MSQLFLHHPRQDKEAIVTCRDKDVSVQIGAKGRKGRTTTHPVRASSAWPETENVVTRMLMEEWQVQSSHESCERFPTVVLANLPGDEWDAVCKASVACGDLEPLLPAPTTATFAPIGFSTFHAKKVRMDLVLMAVFWMPGMYTPQQGLDRDRLVAFAALLPHAIGHVRDPNGKTFSFAEWVKARHEGLPVEIQRNLQRASILPRNPLHDQDAFGATRATPRFIVAL